ncbi:hypothetical protein KKB64_01910 [Patescibacteria group bacterium]|nr:hypothetical protein [Patescibacteria group bacterium]MBU1472527.1 hypothetical protein [Patescibacteria group bacterium]MBU2460100.1 hypothetical protein [Patescibacteria group bacterium]MBU2544669.1 hypothetical protein [Patescibacteria group bacterium]
MIDIIPGILEQDLEEIKRKIDLVSSFVSWVQIDIADNAMVKNETYAGFDAFKPLFESYPSLSFEAHLMVAHPEKYIRPLADAGFKRLIAHVECVDPRLFLEEAKYESVEVGMAVDGPTEIEHAGPFLEEVDVVQIMTIEAGFSGSPFLPEAVEKIKAIRDNFPDLPIPIAVEGGINDQTAKIVVQAGATRLVSTTYLFKHPDRISRAIESLKNP